MIIFYLFYNFIILELKNFLCFVTGSSNVGNLIDIEVNFDALEGAIYASTCMTTLQLPPVVQSYQSFKEAMETILSKNGPSFNII